ncbi:hypothetical protein PENTCL1PPCAC_5175, partial [Pristionchus entomophagus]
LSLSVLVALIALLPLSSALKCYQANSYDKQHSMSIEECENVEFCGIFRGSSNGHGMRIAGCDYDESLCAVEGCRFFTLPEEPQTKGILCCCSGDLCNHATSPTLFAHQLLKKYRM